MRAKTGIMTALLLAAGLGTGLAGFAISGTVQAASATSSGCKPISQPAEPTEGPAVGPALVTP